MVQQNLFPAAMRVSCTTALLGAILLATIAQAVHPDQWVTNHTMPMPEADSWVGRCFIENDRASLLTAGHIFLEESTIDAWARRSDVLVQVWKNEKNHNTLIYTSPAGNLGVTKIVVNKYHMITGVSTDKDGLKYWVTDKTLPLPATRSWLGEQFVEHQVTDLTTDNAVLSASAFNVWAERAGVKIEVYKNGNEPIHTSPAGNLGVIKIFVNNNNTITRVSSAYD